MQIVYSIMCVLKGFVSETISLLQRNVLKGSLECDNLFKGQ